MQPVGRYGNLRGTPWHVVPRIRLVVAVALVCGAISPQKSQAQNLAGELEQGNEICARGDKECTKRNYERIKQKEREFQQSQEICARGDKECNKRNYERVKQRLKDRQEEQTIRLQEARQKEQEAQQEARLRQQALGIQRAAAQEQQAATADAQARAAAEAEAQQAQAAREAKAVRDEGAKKLALADGAKARKAGVEMTIFGVPLGAPLGLPDCQTKPEALFGHLTMVNASSETCLMANQDGSADIRWGKNVELPSWVNDLKTDIRGDVLVAATIRFRSYVGQDIHIGSGLLGTLAAASAASAEGRQAQAAAENVAKAQKQLGAKYGKPTRSELQKFQINGTVVREVYALTWIRPGLEVRYEPGSETDTVRIQVASAHAEQARVEEAKEKAEPKL
jgi:hypothetical protein